MKKIESILKRSLKLKMHVTIVNSIVSNAHGMAGIMESLFSTGRDDTAYIKNRFLHKHGIQVKEFFYY